MQIIVLDDVMNEIIPGVYHGLLAVAPVVLVMGMTITLFTVLTGSGFAYYRGRFAWDVETEKKRKQQIMLMFMGLFIIAAAILHSPYVCLGILPAFVFTWIVL